MAISKKDCALLFYSKTLNVSFERTLMLGRLRLNASREDICSCVVKYKSDSFGLNQILWSNDYAEPLFKLLGANTIESLDCSDYEGATLIHDMNTVIDKSLHSRFSALVDGGTLEHVFNFPVAVMNCMNLLEIGGHYIGVSPANNQMGHGFYQFSPELFYRVFSAENGFRIVKMLVTTTDNGPWYEVADPASVKSRVMLVNRLPLSLIVIAQKVKAKEIFERLPQQSDYQAAWEIASSLKNDKPLDSESILKFYYRKYFPNSVKTVLHPLFDFLRSKKIVSDELGAINPEHFRKVDL